MAAGFKKATVNASDVPATQTNFPSYVDLSRIGITTLAEAQSVRVYADSAKTTEWAREIVSATEMHVKIPSLTSTTEIYVDWDGVSSDYAVTDTYGRNAVWSDYIGVYHMVNANSSTGSNDSSNTGVSFGSSFGKIGDGADFDNSADVLQVTDGASIKPVNITINCWFKPDSLAGFPIFLDRYNASTPDGYRMFLGSNTLRVGIYRGTEVGVTGGTTLSTGTYYYGAATYDGTTLTLYLNGATEGTPLTTSGDITYLTTTNLGMGKRTSGTASNFDGKLDEIRLRATAVSANWITTEYNNQSDEAGFWGTWSDVGGGGSNTTNFFYMT